MTAQTNRDTALRALACLDLTNLDGGCSTDDVEALCKAALTPHGPVAAVCIWPEFLLQARELLDGSGVRLATVANFPGGGGRVLNVLSAVEDALRDGADEIDVVIPYNALLHGKLDHVDEVLKGVRRLCGARKMKVILETGELERPALIRFAADVAIECGAAFVKTSTGKSKAGATLDAARAMLQIIACAERPVGLKVSGGVRSFNDARKYILLAESFFGHDFIQPQTFRFGASGLLTELLKRLNAGDTEPPAGLQGGY